MLARVVLLAHSMSLFADFSLFTLVLVHVAHLLKVAVTGPDYPRIPDGARQWRFEQQRAAYLNQ